MSMLPISPVGSSSTPLAQNRRKGNRHRLHIPATFVLDAYTHTAIDVTVTQLSVGGVGFRSAKSINLESEGALNSFDTLIPPGMRVHVISQRELPSGEFEIGAKVI